MTHLNETSAKRIAAADDLLTAALSRLSSTERMKHAPTVGVVKVLFSVVRTLPPNVPAGMADDWTPLLDKLEPQFDLCEAAGTTNDLIRRIVILDERIGRCCDELTSLAEEAEPTCAPIDRLSRLTIRAQQEILTLAGAQLDRKLQRIEDSLAGHRSLDERRTGEFMRQLEEFRASFHRQSEAFTHTFTVQSGELAKAERERAEEFRALTEGLIGATDADRLAMVTNFYAERGRSDRIRSDIYAVGSYTLLLVGIGIAVWAYYAHGAAPSVRGVTSSATVLALISTVAGLARYEATVHRRRLWNIKDRQDHLTPPMLVLNMTEAQREKYLDGALDKANQPEIPPQVRREFGWRNRDLRSSLYSATTPVAGDVRQGDS